MISSLLAMAFFASGALAADVPADPAIKCPVSGQPAKRSIATDYAGAKVCFCCPACVEPFQKDKARYAARANRQLVATGEAEQVGCPVTGRTPRAELSLSVDDTIVHFCCSACKAKIAQAEPADRFDLVFGRGFDKTFRIKGK
jgi:YHS domain-containing protein